MKSIHTKFGLSSFKTGVILLFVTCFAVVKSHAQIVFSTHSGNNVVPQNSTYSFAVDIENLPAGSEIKAKTHGGVWAESWEEGIDSAKLLLVEEDTSYRIEVAGNRVKLEVDAVAVNLGEHLHKFSIDIYNRGKLLKSWSQDVIFQVEKIRAAVQLLDVYKVYEHVDNRFNVVVSGVPASSIQVNAAGGYLKKTGDDGYILNTSLKPGNKITVAVSAKLNNGRMVKVTEEQFVVEPIPNPEIQIAYTDTVNPAAPVILLTNPVIGSSRFTVISWELELNITGEKKAFKGTGNRLSEEALQSWKKLKPGDNYLFKNVETKMGSRRLLLSKQAVIY